MLALASNSRETQEVFKQCSVSSTKLNLNRILCLNAKQRFPQPFKIEVGLA